MSDALFSIEDQVVLVFGQVGRLRRPWTAPLRSRVLKVIITGRDLQSLKRAEKEIEEGSSEDFAMDSGGSCEENSGGKGGRGCAGGIGCVSV